MKTVRLGEAKGSLFGRRAFGFTVISAVLLLFGPLTANASTYYSTYGQSRSWNITLTVAGTHTFEVDGIAQYKTTDWYVNGVYKQTDSSGFFAIDPDYSWSFSSGTTEIKARVYNSDNTLRETHVWNLAVQTIISAYWLAPNYVTQGAVATMRAQVTGFNVGDQFAFDIREDDSPFGYDSVTTKYGKVYSSGGILYVDATWTTVWQSDQFGDPEFYFVVSGGGVSRESGRTDADEMHVAVGPVLSRTPSSLSTMVAQGQNASSQIFEVWNSGGGTMSYSVSDDAPWLTVSPSNGTSTGEHDTFTVSYSTVGLSVGTYNATVTINATGAIGSPQTIPVTVTVNPPPQTIISAYWLAPNYVTEGAVATMRAQVTGFSVGDQFAFDIHEDDSPFGYDYVTTKYGNVYSSGGSLYVDTTWTTVWQSDQSGDPEFYFVVSRNGTSFQSSTADADEMHVGQGDRDDQISEATPLETMDQTRTKSGTIESATDVDMYSFSVVAGQRISFDIDRPSGALAAYLRVFDASGNELAHNAGGAGPGEPSGTEAYLEYMFLSAGTFYVGVSGLGNNSYNPLTGSGDAYGSAGTYTLVVSPGIAGTARVNGVETDYLVDIVRIDQKAIDPSQRTWIVIHGRNSSRTTENIADVAASIAETRTNDQVLTLDWSGAASYFGWAGFGGEDAIQNVGAWAAAALQGKGFVGTNLNLVGHSWGSYVADELAERIPGGVDTITALDAAENVPGGYSPESPGEIDFSRDSLFSWAFHSDGTFGSNVTPPTSDEAFIVANSNHGNVVFLFAYMLLHPNDVVGQYFLLNYLLLAQPGPWVPDQYISRLGIENPIGGYEAVIVAGPSGSETQSIQFVTNAPSLSITSHANGATVGSSPILLFGTATDAGHGGSGISSVIVDGIRANNDSADGTGIADWTMTLNLSVGINKILVVARDDSAGQTATTNVVTINYVPLPPPALAITYSNGFVTLSWHVDYSDFALQQTDNLIAADSWSAISTQPTTIDSSNVVVVPLSQSKQFFRVRKP